MITIAQLMKKFEPTQEYIEKLKLRMETEPEVVAEECPRWGEGRCQEDCSLRPHCKGFGMFNFEGGVK